MKFFLTIAGAGILGLIVGAIPGYLKGQPFAVASGTISGVCSVADAAVQAKVLTPDQAEQLGAAFPERVSPSEAKNHINGVQGVGEGCKRALTGMAQGAK